MRKDYPDWVYKFLAILFVIALIYKLIEWIVIQIR